MLKHEDKVVAETKYLRLVDRGGWSFVQRHNATGVVCIIALTDEDEIIFVEQLRKPVDARTIELPAGLAGDEAEFAQEDLKRTAERELLEETGYQATTVIPLMTCPTSPGMTDEMVSFFLATGLRKVGPGGGVAGEDIELHIVPLQQAHAFLQSCASAGRPVAAKALAGLHLALMTASKR